MSAETLEREAILELAAVLKLPPASGTVSRLVRLLIDAAVARMEEAAQPSLSACQAIGHQTIGKCPNCGNELVDRFAKQTLGLRK